MRHYSLRRFLTVLAVLSLAFTACGDDGDKSASGNANVRFVHAASGEGTPVVDVWINGNPPADGSEFNNISFGSATTYKKISSGSHNIAIVQDGETLDNTAAVFFKESVDFQANSYTTIYAHGRGSGDGIDVASYTSTSSDTGGVQATPSGARFIHAGYNADSVDIFVDGSTSQATGIAEGQASGQLTLPAEQPVLLGVAEAGESRTIADFEINPPGGANIALFATGDFEVPGAESQVLLLVLGDGSVVQISAKEYAYLRVFHAANEGASSIFVSDGSPATADPVEPSADRLTLVEGDFDSYMRIEPGNYDIAFAPENETDIGNALGTASHNIDANSHYTAFTYGSQTGGDIGVGIIEDDIESAASIGLAHAASIGSDRHFYMDGGTALEEALPGTTYAHTAVSAGYHSIGVSDSTTTIPTEQYAFLIEGGHHDLFLVGSAANSNIQMAQVGPDGTVTIVGEAAQLRALHATDLVGDEGPIDLYANGIRIGDDIEFQKAINYVALPAGDISIQAIAGDVTDIASAPAEDIIFEGTNTMASGDRGTLIIHSSDDAAAVPTGFLIDDPRRDQLEGAIDGGSNEVALQLAHAIPTASGNTVDLSTTSPAFETVVPLLPYQEAQVSGGLTGSSTTSYNAGMTDFTANTNGIPGPDLEFNGVDLGPSLGDFAALVLVEGINMIVLHTDGTTAFIPGENP